MGIALSFLLLFLIILSPNGVLDLTLNKLHKNKKKEDDSTINDSQVDHVEGNINIDVHSQYSECLEESKDYALVEEIPFSFDSIFNKDSELIINCSGEFGEGSNSAPAGNIVAEQIGKWISANPNIRIKCVEIDFSKVNYEWGDGPMIIVVAAYKNNIEKIRIRSNE